MSKSMRAALQRLETAARNRDNTSGDICRLLEVKAELAAAADEARDALAGHDDLLAAAKLALAEAESWIHDQLDGTSGLERALAELEPVRAAIAKTEG